MEDYLLISKPLNNHLKACYGSNKKACDDLRQTVLAQDHA